MTEDEKRGFEHGCRVMIKMMEECGFIFEKSGKYTFANAFFGFVDRAEHDVERMTELYAAHGYETIMKAVEHREEEDTK